MSIFYNLPDEILKYIYTIALHNIHINSVLYLIKNFKTITNNRNKNNIKKYYESETFYEFYYKYLSLIKKSPIKITKIDKLNHYSIIYKFFWYIQYDICNIS